MSVPKRYYAQWFNGFWKVFDRQRFDPEVDDEDTPIASCFLRFDAFKIRDALNEQEQRK